MLVVGTKDFSFAPIAYTSNMACMSLPFDSPGSGNAAIASKLEYASVNNQ